MSSTQSEIALLPDARPLITLAYADALDLLFRPGWSVQLADMVLHEVTRNQTPTRDKLMHWVQENQLPILPTKAFKHYQHAQTMSVTALNKNNLGELAIQEIMNDFALLEPAKTGIFLFEDHKIARATFLVPDNCRRVSTRAFLLFLEQKEWLDSAAKIERQAILAGRAFSKLCFPLE